MPLSETPQKLSEKIDLQKLQDRAGQDIPDLLMGFRNLNEGLREETLSVSLISVEDKGKSQAGIILDALHKLDADEIVSELKRLGMNIRPCLNGTTEASDVSLATNFLLLASKPSNLLEVAMYRDLAKCVFAFEESIALIRDRKTTQQINAAIVGASIMPGDGGGGFANILIY